MSVIVSLRPKAIGIGGEDLNIVLSGDSAYVSMFSAGKYLPHPQLAEAAWPLDVL
jgi:hypothetical protein